MGYLRSKIPPPSFFLIASDKYWGSKSSCSNFLTTLTMAPRGGGYSVDLTTLKLVENLYYI